MAVRMRPSSWPAPVRGGAHLPCPLSYHILLHHPHPFPPHTLTHSTITLVQHTMRLPCIGKIDPFFIGNLRLCWIYFYRLIYETHSCSTIDACLPWLSISKPNRRRHQSLSIDPSLNLSIHLCVQVSSVRFTTVWITCWTFTPWEGAPTTLDLPNVNYQQQTTKKQTNKQGEEEVLPPPPPLDRGAESSKQEVPALLDRGAEQSAVDPHASDAADTVCIYVICVSLSCTVSMYLT
jgi:hypothetical protein